MSHVQRIDGIIIFQTDDQIQDCLTHFENHDIENSIRFHADTLHIEIPRDTYKNFNRHTDWLLDNGHKGFIAGTMHTQTWSGFLKRVDGTHETTDLKDWAQSRPELTSPPMKQNYASEIAWHNEYVVWKSQVAKLYLNETTNQQPETDKYR